MFMWVIRQEKMQRGAVPTYLLAERPDETLAVQEAIAQGATDEEVKAVRKNWDDQKQVAQFMEAMAQEVQRVEHLRQSLKPAAKQQVLGLIAAKYGVVVEDIAHADNPQTAEAIAMVLAKRNKGQVLQERKKNGTDRVESGGGGHTDLSKLSPLEKIRLGIEQSKAVQRR